MKEGETYRTIRKASTGSYKEKGSRFLSFAYPVKNKEQADELISGLRKKYHDARHHCYAYILNPDHSEYRFNDDGEPSNTAGQPILGQIKANGLTNILVVVVRYFGGTLLGVGGLIRAYKSAAAEAVKNASIITHTIQDNYEINFAYEHTSSVMKILEQPGITVSEKHFEEQVKLVIGINKSISDEVLNKINRIDGVKISYIDSG